MARVMRARVKQGRLILDEPTELPEGAEVELVLAHPGASPAEAARPADARPEHVEGARFLATQEPGDEPEPPSQGPSTDAMIEEVQRQARG